MKLRNFAWILLILSLSASVNAESYQVKKGDSLWSISKKFNMKPVFITSLNDITNNKITPGQVLMIPVGTIDYMVVKGDSISRIAHEYNLKTGSVKKINGLDSDFLREGQILVIPVFGKELKPALRVPGKAAAVCEKKGNSLFNPVNSQSETPDPGNKKFVLPVNIGDVRDVRNSGRGIVVLLKTSAPVRSIQNGVVKFCNKMSGYDNVIIIGYGDEYYAVFGFIGKSFVRNGETVSENQSIGNAGNIDSGSGRGFYLEMRCGRKSLNVRELYPELNMKEIAMKKHDPENYENGEE